MENITLVLGAGVNKEIHPGIDLGYELIKNTGNRVTDRTSVVPNFSNVLQKLGVKHLTREEFVFHLDNYMNGIENGSIDSFLYELGSYPEFEMEKNDFLTIGRLSIVFHVLGYEGTSLQTNIKEEVAGTRTTWLSVIADFIQINGLLKSDVFKIITFNYDRILEYFLDKKFGTAAREFIINNIVHVYGNVGDKFDLGKIDNDNPAIIDRIYDIRLIHERANTDVATLIADSKKIIVMGYGLDPMNNKRLGLQDCKIGENVIFNIYPGKYYHFKERRRMAALVRELVLDATIHYSTSCRSFVKNCLSH